MDALKALSGLEREGVGNYILDIATAHVLYSSIYIKTVIQKE